MVLVAGGLLALATVIAYHNSFSGVFVYDDTPAITDNPTIRHLWPLRDVLSPPRDSGVTVNGRPLVNLSLAVNYAIGGTQVWGYHAVNLLIHLFAGLTFFGILRRTFLQPSLSERFGRAALPLALATAVLWTIHPLQTESVTYVVQRAEALVGLFYLLTVYCFIRGTAAGAAAGWYPLAVAACLAGMASKEVMVSAPLMVVLFDRTFVSGSFRAAWQRHGRLYLGLAGTWLLLGYLVAASGNRGGTAGFSYGVSWWVYAMTQCRAIVRYLGLSLWPHPLVFDYGTGVIRQVTVVLPQLLALATLVAGTLVSLRRWPALGFLGMWFFAILAPSSSVLPVVTETMAEHRMYLPLASVAVLVVTGLFAAAGRMAWPILFALMLALGATTIRRNIDYHSELVIWASTVQRFPECARAHNNLGEMLARTGRPEEEAMAQYREAIRLLPNYLDALCNLGNSQIKTGQHADAMATLGRAAQINPNYAPIQNALGHAYYVEEKLAEATERFERALKIRPNYAEAHNNLGVILVKFGKVDEAVAHYREALRLKSDYPDACYNYGNALVHLGQIDEAIRQFEQTLRLKAGYAEAHNNLGGLMVQLNRVPEALAHFEQAVQLKPNYADARNNLGVVLFKTGRGEEAIVQFEEALRINPDYGDARNNLADVKKALQVPATNRP